MPIEFVGGVLRISNSADPIGQNESVAICLRSELGVQSLLSAVASAAMQIKDEWDVGVTNSGCGYLHWHLAMQTTGMYRHSLPARNRARDSATCGRVTERRQQQEHTRQSNGQAVLIGEADHSSHIFLHPGRLRRSSSFIPDPGVRFVNRAVARAGRDG